MKFLDIFTPITKGNFSLTEESIYKSIQYGDKFIPIWGGNNEHDTVERMVSIRGKTKSNKPITIFNGGIIISLDGSAGSMTCKEPFMQFALNHHAGFFNAFDIEKIIPQFFTLFFEDQLKEISVSDGSKTLTPEQIYKEDFEIPSMNDQIKIMDMINPLLETKNNILDVLQKINQLKKMTFSHTYSNFQIKSIPISKILDYKNGNSGLTEHQIYNNLSTSENKYTVLSSSTKNTSFGKIPMCKINGTLLKVFEDKNGILINRVGNAGNSRYLEKGNYAITENAYILYLNDKLKYVVKLKWIMYALKSIILEYSPYTDYGAWNMSRFFERALIDIPIIDEQNQIISIYEKMENIENALNSNLSKINILLSKKLIVKVITHIQD